jgi:ketosteroid isomerase-like protein
MRALTRTVLVLGYCLSAQLAVAQPAKAPPQSDSVAETIKQLERDWTEAMINGDTDKLSRALADDFVEIGSAGKVITKAGFLNHTRSDKQRLTAVEFGPEDVSVWGHVAVLQGSATETWITDGRTTTTRIAYMDVYVKRGDEWLMVRSHAKPL